MTSAFSQAATAHLSTTLSTMWWSALGHKFGGGGGYIFKLCKNKIKIKMKNVCQDRTKHNNLSDMFLLNLKHHQQSDFPKYLLK